MRRLVTPKIPASALVTGAFAAGWTLDALFGWPVTGIAIGAVFFATLIVAPLPYLAEEYGLRDRIGPLSRLPRMSGTAVGRMAPGDILVAPVFGRGAGLRPEPF